MTTNRNEIIEETKTVDGLRKLVSAANTANCLVVEADGTPRFGWQADEKWKPIALRHLAEHPPTVQAAPGVHAAAAPQPAPHRHAFALEVTSRDAVRTRDGALLRPGVVLELPLRQDDHIARDDGGGVLFVLTPSKNTPRPVTHEEWLRLRVADPSAADLTLDQAITQAAERRLQEEQKALEQAEAARIAAEREAAEAEERARVEASKKHRHTLRSLSLWGLAATRCPGFARSWVGPNQSVPLEPWRKLEDGRGLWIFAGMAGVGSPGANWLPEDYELELTVGELAELRARVGSVQWSGDIIREVLEVRAEHHPADWQPIADGDLRGYGSQDDETYTESLRPLAKTLAGLLSTWGIPYGADQCPPFTLPWIASTLVRGHLRAPSVASDLVLTQIPAGRGPGDMFRTACDRAARGERPFAMHAAGCLLPQAARAVATVRAEPPPAETEKAAPTVRRAR